MEAPAQLSAGLCARDVEIDLGPRSLGPYRVGPAPVGAAIALIECGAAAADPADEEHEDAWAIVADAIRSWLPPAMATFLTAGGASRAETVEIVTRQLAVGVLDRAAYERAEGDVKRKAAETSWSAVVAEYRVAYGLTLTEALAEPWGGFLNQYGQIDRLLAQQEVTMARAIGAALDADAFADALERAGWTPPPPTEEEKRAEQAANLAELHRVFLATSQNPSA